MMPPIRPPSRAQVAANLMTDEMLMRSAQLTPEYRPLVDFHSQYSTVQNQKGWRYGCAQRPSLHRPALILPGAQQLTFPRSFWGWMPVVQLSVPSCMRNKRFWGCVFHVLLIRGRSCEALI